MEDHGREIDFGGKTYLRSDDEVNGSAFVTRARPRPAMDKLKSMGPEKVAISLKRRGYTNVQARNILERLFGPRPVMQKAKALFDADRIRPTPQEYWQSEKIRTVGREDMTKARERVKRGNGQDKKLRREVAKLKDERAALKKELESLKHEIKQRQQQLDTLEEFGA